MTTALLAIKTHLQSDRYQVKNKSKEHGEHNLIMQNLTRSHNDRKKNFFRLNRELTCYYIRSLYINNSINH